MIRVGTSLRTGMSPQRVLPPVQFWTVVGPAQRDFRRVINVTKVL
jgi:hypothetical protein